MRLVFTYFTSKTPPPDFGHINFIRNIKRNWLQNKVDDNGLQIQLSFEDIFTSLLILL